MPFIYGVSIPIIVLDISVEIYHRICFPLYGLAYVKRSNYIRIDRHRLSYLKWPEKINCMYCGYANGLAQYFAAIAGETEVFWCGIKHQESKDFLEPVHHQDFLEYNDQNGFQNFLKG